MEELLYVCGKNKAYIDPFFLRFYVAKWRPGASANELGFIAHSAKIKLSFRDALSRSVTDTW